MSISIRLKNFLGVVKTTAIGGLFFLLPMIVIGVLIGKIVQVLIATARIVDSYLPFHSAYAYAALLAIGFVALL